MRNVWLFISIVVIVVVVIVVIVVVIVAVSVVVIIVVVVVGDGIDGGRWAKMGDSSLLIYEEGIWIVIDRRISSIGL